MYDLNLHAESRKQQMKKGKQQTQIQRRNSDCRKEGSGELNAIGGE